ncbi:unnamed protein product, partial [Allacma fusca]
YSNEAHIVKKRKEVYTKINTIVFQNPLPFEEIFG